MADTLGILNLLRYRGYVYDQETGLYYLQSRYYDPEIGRFLNADDFLLIGEILGNNIFVYCFNNPMACVDPYGQFPLRTEITNPNAMLYKNGFIYWGDFPWDEDGELKDTFVKKAPKRYSEMEEVGYVHLVDGACDVYSGVEDITKGFGLVLVPCPTPIEDIKGVGLMTYGVLELVGGITKIVIGIIRGNTR